MGSLLLVYGCLVFLVAETELPLALDSVLEEQNLPPQHSLVLSCHPPSQTPSREKPCSLPPTGRRGRKAQEFTGHTHP